MQPGTVQEERKPSGLRDCFALWVDALSFLKGTLYHQAHERHGYEVQEQGADHLQHAETQLQPNRDYHPQEPGHCGANEKDCDCGSLGNRAELQPHPGSGYGTGVELSLRTDVECAATKRDGDAEPYENQGYRTNQCRRGECVPGSKGA